MGHYARYPSLFGKSVLVTGGASGIGAKIVEEFVEQGSKVAFIDLDENSGQRLLTTIGDEHAFECCDLRNIDALRDSIEKLNTCLGPFSVLVNNAAHDDRHNWADVTSDYWDERMATNLRHMFFAIQSVAPGMIRAGGGSIINLGSGSWWQAVGGMPAYTTAKSAVHGLTRTMARDLGQHRIRVNTVVPGWIMTQRQKELWVTPEEMRQHLVRQCLPDAIEPVFVARMVLFLASDDAAMCSANNYMVEAGSI